MLNICHLPVRFLQYFASNDNDFNFPGRLPFIRANKFVVAEMDPIVAFVNTKVSYQNIKNYLQISKYEKVAKTLFIVNLQISVHFDEFF